MTHSINNLISLRSFASMFALLLVALAIPRTLGAAQPQPQQCNGPQCAADFVLLVGTNVTLDLASWTSGRAKYQNSCSDPCLDCIGWASFDYNGTGTWTHTTPSGTQTGTGGTHFEWDTKTECDGIPGHFNFAADGDNTIGDLYCRCNI